MHPSWIGEGQDESGEVADYVTTKKVGDLITGAVNRRLHRLRRRAMVPHAIFSISSQFAL